jgi:hypothetical protein
MLPYEEQAYIELEIWKKKILKKPGFFDLASKGIQNRLNKIIPEKVIGLFLILSLQEGAWVSIIYLYNLFIILVISL